MIGNDPGTGKMICRSIYGKTQREVRQKMTAIIGDLDEGTYHEPQKITVKVWFDTWMNTFCKNTAQPLSYEKYDRSIKNHIIPCIGALELKDVRGFHIQKVYDTMIDEKKLSPKTVKDAGALCIKLSQLPSSRN